MKSYKDSFCIFHEILTYHKTFKVTTLGTSLTLLQPPSTHLNVQLTIPTSRDKFCGQMSETIIYYFCFQRLELNEEVMDMGVGKGVGDRETLAPGFGNLIFSYQPFSTKMFFSQF